MDFLSVEIMYFVMNVLENAVFRNHWGLDAGFVILMLFGRKMPSSEKFRDHVLAQFNGELFDGGFRVTTRKMMGEYILYADGKIFGGIYDDRLLVKPVAAAKAMLPDAKLQLPYDGAKPMLRVTAEQIADNGLLVRLLDAMLPELPAVKKKK